MPHASIVLSLALLSMWPQPGQGGELDCISGSPADMRLVSIFHNQENPDNVPIQLWREYRAQRSDPSTTCQMGSQSLTSQSQPVIRAANVACNLRTIRPLCVELALENVPNITRRKGTKSYICERIGQPAIEPRSGTPPCVTKDMANYLTWITNQSLTCLSPETDPLDAKSAFYQLNNESGFGYFVASINGSGLAQITKPTLNEMMRKDRGFKVIEKIQKLLNNPSESSSPQYKACSVFRSAIKDLNGYSATEKIPRPSCLYSQPGNGVATSAFLYSANMLYLRDLYNNSTGSATQAVKRIGLNPLTDPIAAQIRNELTQVCYNVGPKCMAIFATTMARVVKTNSGFSAHFLKQFHADVKTWFADNRENMNDDDYLSAIAERRTALHDKPQLQAAIKDRSQSPAKGDVCIE